MRKAKDVASEAPGLALVAAADLPGDIIQAGGNPSFEPAALSLWQIEQELAELVEFREELALNPQTTEEYAESVKVTDLAIQEYIGREIRKVTGIAALLKHFKAMEAMAAAEVERVDKRRKGWEGRYERLKAMVHGVMIAMDVPKLEGATDRFRRQNNPEAVEVVEYKELPDDYLRATIRMNQADWKEVVRLLKSIDDGATFETMIGKFLVSSEVDTTKLKKALQAPAECGECGGFGQKASADGKAVEVCGPCSGTGQVAAVVPGAKLRRGEHLRIE